MCIMTLGLCDMGGYPYKIYQLATVNSLAYAGSILQFFQSTDDTG